MESTSSPADPSYGAIARGIARELHAVVIPVSRDKRPALKGWRRVTFDECATPQFLAKFTAEFPNVGIVQGKASTGLCSIDCDSQEALDEFLRCNPRLQATIITKARRGGNVWVRICGDCPRLAKLTKHGLAWGEFRGEGGFTVFAGTHAEGMPYRRSGGELVSLALEEIVWPPGVILGGEQREDSRPLFTLNSSDTLPAASLPSESLPPCTAASLHHTRVNEEPAERKGEERGNQLPPPAPAEILKMVQDRRVAEDQFAREHPTLLNLYEKFIERRFQAVARGRNAFLVQAVPFLYRALAPEFIVPLTTYFYRMNRALFRDSLAQHQKEARAMLSGVGQTYLSSLGQVDRQIYEALPDDQGTVFRICRDLAQQPDPPDGPGSFFMSCDQLADRLGSHPMAASRLLQAFASCGLIRVLKPGQRRAKGSPGEATTFRWMLPLPAAAKQPA